MNTCRTFEFSVATCASQGQRPQQEDHAETWRPSDSGENGATTPALIVVADGMGGHVSGQVASKLACEEYIKAFCAESGDVGPRMANALYESNQALSNAIHNNSQLNGMGCTLVAGYLDENGLRWVSVGDSALLVYRKGTLRRLNADHSHGALLDQQVAEGILTEEAASKDKRRRALHSAITGHPIPLQDLELHGYALEDDDWVIVCTDGVFTLSGNEVASLICDNSDVTPEKLAAVLLAAVEAQNNPKQDNTTLTAVHVRCVQSESASE